MKRRIFVVTAAAALGLARVIIACGDDDDSVSFDAGMDAPAEARTNEPIDAAGDADASVEAGALAAPTFTPPSGTTMLGPFCVTIRAPAGVIHYTTDGTMPNEQSPVASEAIPITKNGQTTILAVAIDGPARSLVVSASYAVQYPPVATPAAPTFNPTATTRDAGFTLALSTGGLSAICYSLDGGTVDCVHRDPPQFVCSGADASVPVPQCAAGITYEGGLPMAGDAGTSITVTAVACTPYNESDIVKQTYSFE